MAFELAETGRGLLAKHSAIVVTDGSVNTSRGLQVFDWPQAGDELSAIDLQEGKSRTLDIEDSGVILGWIAPNEAGRLPGARSIIAEARELLASAVKDFGGAISDTLYFPYPARQRPYEVKNDNGKTVKVEFAGSCAGFVEECYEAAGFDLVVDDDNSLPGWYPEELHEVGPFIFPDYTATSASALERYMRRKKYPIPCGVFFSGYQLHAFGNHAYPFIPASTDDAFL